MPLISFAPSTHLSSSTGPSRAKAFAPLFWSSSLASKKKFKFFICLLWCCEKRGGTKTKWVKEPDQPPLPPAKEARNQDAHRVWLCKSMDPSGTAPQLILRSSQCWWTIEMIHSLWREDIKIKSSSGGLGVFNYSFFERERAGDAPSHVQMVRRAVAGISEKKYISCSWTSSNDWWSNENWF